jgi:AmiR/NasT family two-component response regulator
VDKKTILIISEHPADFYSLTAALDRADPARFHPVTVNTRDQPVDALMDPMNDSVILAYTLETEYLLRLAQKKNLSVPIIVLIDQESEAQVGKLKDAGATDYIVRGLISDDMLHRILDYSMVLNHVTLQHAQVVEQQRIERAAQQAGEHLQSVTEAVGNGVVHTTPAGVGESRPGSAATLERPPGASAGMESKSTPTQASKAALSHTPTGRWSASPWSASPWKAAILALIVVILLVCAALLSQRLDSESRLSRLEASNDILSQQVLQLHSDLTQTKLVPAVPEITPPGPADTIEVFTTPPAPESPPPLQAVTTPTFVAAEQEPDQASQVQLQDPAGTVTVTAAAEIVEPVMVDEGISDSVPITGITAVTSGAWFINMGTFSSEGAARRFARSLGPTAHQLELQPVLVGGRELYRVRLVDLPSAEAAEEVATDYQIRLGGSRPWVGRD